MGAPFALETDMKRLIYCPDCARELYYVGERQTMHITKRCECGRFYDIDPQLMSAKRVKRPERTSSSGDRFY